jgi:hypothetical protein
VSVSRIKITAAVYAAGAIVAISIRSALTTFTIRTALKIAVGTTLTVFAVTVFTVLRTLTIRSVALHSIS